MKEGRVQYTANAFQQDADLAIKQDLVAALIELITNADDAYGSKPGPITITISKPDPKSGIVDVSVKDQARGLTPEELVEKFTVLGGENSQFLSGENSRGLLGRGAKDVAGLGSVTFAAIKDDIFTELTLTRDSKFRQEDELRATDEQRKILGLAPGENGLTATIHVDVDGLNIKLPKALKLIEKLSTHAQLRDLIGRRQVVFIDRRSKLAPTTLVYEKPKSTEILNETFQVTGYPGKVTLVLRRMDTYSKGALDAYSDHGILVRSGITIYENSGFGQHNHQSMGYISGELFAEDINRLIREHDKSGGKQTGGRLIRRDRDGLVKEHPYTFELNKAVQSRLNPILEKISDETMSQGGQGENLTRALKDAAKALQKEVKEILEELDLGDSLNGETWSKPLIVIPPRLKIAPGETRILTVRAQGSPEAELEAFLANEDSEKLLSLVLPTPTDWQPHTRLDASLAHFKVTAGENLGDGKIAVHLKGESVQVDISVAEPSFSDPEVVEQLQFKTSKAKIAPTKTRTLELRAPLHQCDEEVVIDYEGVEILEAPKKVLLKPSAAGDWASALVKIKTTNNVGALTINARDSHGAEASAILNVEEGGPQGGDIFDFELVRGLDFAGRVSTSDIDGVLNVKVYTSHPAFAGVFGKYDESKKSYQREDTPEARKVLAEVLSRAIAEDFTVKQSLREPADFTDGPRYFARCNELTERFLKAFNATLKSK